MVHFLGTLLNETVDNVFSKKELCDSSGLAWAQEKKGTADGKVTK